jgi:hypothetical protein
MSTTVTETVSAFRKLELRGPYGNFFRTVSTAEPRQATAEEIPVIDISGIYGDLSERTQLAAEIKTAVERYGFFYIKNHGIPKEIIQKAEKQARAFFKQQVDQKEKAGSHLSKYFNGWSKPNSRQVSPSESIGRIPVTHILKPIF